MSSSRFFKTILDTAVHGPQETVQLVTQQVREALHDQHETARRALLHQQGQFLASTHHCEAAARQNLCEHFGARNTEAPNYEVQKQVRQREHEADARCSQRLRELWSWFSQEANQALEKQREILATEVTSEVWRRGEQVYTIYVRNSVFKHYTRKTLRNSWTTSALDRIGSGNTANIEKMFEESQASDSATGPDLERLRQREAQNFYEKYDIKMMTEPDLMHWYQGIGQTRNLMSPEPQETSKSLAIHAATSCNWQHPLKSWTPSLKVKNFESQSLQRDLQTTQDSLNSWDDDSWTGGLANGHWTLDSFVSDRTWFVRFSSWKLRKNSTVQTYCAVSASLRSSQSCEWRASRWCESPPKQNKLNSWDEVNVNSIQGVCADEHVETSTSSVSRITETAVTSPQAGGRPRAVSTEREYNAAAPKYTTDEKLEQTEWQSTVILSRRLFLLVESTEKLQWSPWLWRTLQERSRGIFFVSMASTNRIQKLEH